VVTDSSIPAGPPRLDARLLVVEDHPVNQRVMQIMLTRMGAQVTLAADGEQALQALRSGRFDAVLMDCQMPVLDGYEATARIRAGETSRRLPIIALTANVSSDDRQRCLDAGMDDFLAKPVSAEKLAEVLSHWIKGHALPQQGGAGAGNPPAAGPPIDAGALERLVKILSEEELANTITLYFDSAGRHLQGLELCAARGDLAGFALAAHSLKSMTAILGGKYLAQLATEGERLGRSGDAAAFALLPQIARALEEFRAVLAAHPCMARAAPPAPGDGTPP
jgi:CheY-like chemotaxis protein